MSHNADFVPTWGYRPSGEARIFDLVPGESLPDGWHASPSVIADPALATAEALSAAAARSAAAEREQARSMPERTTASPSSGDAALLAENERLRAESARLTAELDATRARLAEDESARADRRDEAETEDAGPASAPVEASPDPRENPPDDRACRSPDPETGDAPVQLGQPRSREEAREAARALLGEGLSDREIARRVGISPSTVAAVRRASA